MRTWTDEDSNLILKEFSNAVIIREPELRLILPEYDLIWDLNVNKTAEIIIKDIKDHLEAE